MPPKSSKPGFMTRLASLVKGPSSKSAAKPSQTGAETANTSLEPLFPHDPSTPSIPLPPENKPTALSAQSSISQEQSIHPSTNSRSMAVANCFEASTSTPISQDPVSKSSIRSQSDGKIATLHNPEDRSSSSHSLMTTSQAGPSPMSLLEGAHHFQMGDVVNIFNEVGVRQNALDNGT